MSEENQESPEEVQESEAEKPQDEPEAQAPDAADAAGQEGDDAPAKAEEVEEELAAPVEVLVEADKVIRSGGEIFDPKELGVKIKLHNFRNSVFLTESEMRQMQQIHENFASYMASRFSMYLRMDFEVKFKDLNTKPYHEFTEEIPSPSFISIYRIDPINGVGVISLDPQLAMVIVDRLLGGQGNFSGDERVLTEIEESLMQEVLQMMLEEWCRQWEDVQDLRTVILGHESNGRFLQTSEKDAVVMVMKSDITIGECTAPMIMSIPFTALEPLIKKLSQEKKSYAQSVQMKEPGQWRTAYDDISVPVYAEWDACDVSVKDFLNLRKGDILELPLDIMQKTRLRFKNTTRYEGEVGVHESQVAVRITRSLEE